MGLKDFISGRETITLKINADVRDYISNAQRIAQLTPLVQKALEEHVQNEYIPLEHDDSLALKIEDEVHGIIDVFRLALWFSYNSLRRLARETIYGDKETKQHKEDLREIFYHNELLWC